MSPAASDISQKGRPADVTANSVSTEERLKMGNAETSSEEGSLEEGIAVLPGGSAAANAVNSASIDSPYDESMDPMEPLMDRPVSNKQTVF